MYLGRPGQVVSDLQKLWIPLPTSLPGSSLRPSAQFLPTEPMRTQLTSVGTCYNEPGGPRLERGPGPCRWHCPLQSLQMSQTCGRKQSRASAALGQQVTWGAAQGHLHVLFGCRTKCPLGVGLRLQEWGSGPMVTKPSSLPGAEPGFSGKGILGP